MTKRHMYIRLNRYLFYIVVSFLISVPYVRCHFYTLLTVQVFPSPFYRICIIYGICEGLCSNTELFKTPKNRSRIHTEENEGAVRLSENVQFKNVTDEM